MKRRMWAMCCDRRSDGHKKRYESNQTEAHPQSPLEIRERWLGEDSPGLSSYSIAPRASRKKSRRKKLYTDADGVWGAENGEGAKWEALGQCSSAWHSNQAMRCGAKDGRKDGDWWQKEPLGTSSSWRRENHSRDRLGNWESPKRNKLRIYIYWLIDFEWEPISSAWWSSSMIPS